MDGWPRLGEEIEGFVMHCLSDRRLPGSTRRRRGGVWRWAGVFGVVAIGAVVLCWLLSPEGVVPDFSIPIGQVREPLAFRQVSFHRGRVDKNLVKLASQLGFNGVQVQLEGSNIQGIRDFAARDRKEHIVDYCHAHGMKVTVWVRELSDLPTEDDPDYLGPVDVDNQELWDVIDQRYEWILGQALPWVDGLVLTVVETQFNATEAAVMQKLVTLINGKCRKYGKSLTVRTFVWKPEELEGVMEAIQGLPDDILVMSKIVPQDWQMRAGNAAEIGAVGGHRQIVEFDAAGEYFLSDNVANCMVERLKSQFDYAVAKGAEGVCVRVDRFDASVLWTPNEVNVWALGLLASGASGTTEDIWQRWASYRYGEKAAPAVIAALKPTSEVVAEMVSVGPFTYGDIRGAQLDFRPRYEVALPTSDVLGEWEESNQNWQMWRWDPALVATLGRINAGDGAFINGIQKSQAHAAALADQSLAELEKGRAFLAEKDYQILQTKLLTNKLQLAYRSHATLAALHWRQALAAETIASFSNAMRMYHEDIEEVQALSDSLRSHAAGFRIHYLGKNWQVGYPLLISPDQLDGWVQQARDAVRPY